MSTRTVQRGDGFVGVRDVMELDETITQVVTCSKESKGSETVGKATHLFLFAG